MTESVIDHAGPVSDHPVIDYSPGAVTPGSQQGPTIQPPPGGSSIREQDQDSFSGHHGMMGPGMMGHGMMGPGYGHHDWHQGRNIAGFVMMRMMFSLMDADGC